MVIKTHGATNVKTAEKNLRHEKKHLIFYFFLTLFVVKEEEEKKQDVKKYSTLLLGSTLSHRWLGACNNYIIVCFSEGLKKNLHSPRLAALRALRYKRCLCVDTH